MATLTDAYCDWFESLAPEVAKELTLLLMRLFPGGLLEPTLTTPNITDGFVPRMRRIGQKPGFPDAGHALTLAGLTDFIFLSRGDPAQWTEDRELLEVLDQARAALGESMDDDVSEWIEQNRLRYPLRAKLWTKAAESWAEIRRVALSDAQIRTSLKTLPSS